MNAVQQMRSCCYCDYSVRLRKQTAADSWMFCVAAGQLRFFGPEAPLPIEGC